MNLSERIPETRLLIAKAELLGTYEAPKYPSKLYRLATKPTKKLYDFKKLKKKKKVAKQSRKINRSK